MPIIKSAKKRVKVAAKARARNVRTKRSLRAALKTYAAAIESGKTAEIQKAQQEAFSALDIAVKKAVIHKNKAARQKSVLAAQAKAAGAKPSKSTAAKTPVKKTAAKKTAAKKPAAKKPAPKK
jgi:small subunit ribosomal protein S20